MAYKAAYKLEYFQLFSIVREWKQIILQGVLSNLLRTHYLYFIYSSC